MLLRVPVWLAIHAAIARRVLGDASTKRGLVFVPSDDASDASIWTSHSPDDLTWYYNYAAQPSSELSGSQLEFVPMLWGTDGSDGFARAVRAQRAGGSTIRYALGFNEPDGTRATGGSQTDVSTAVDDWIREMEPLRQHDIKLGAPAVTGSERGLAWLASFFDHCAGRCHVDFIPVHWYGDFEGFASYLGQVRAAYPHTELWVTEFALADQNLHATQVFYNQSASYLDQLRYVTHYSYFGAFRSDVSNVGPNAAMLTADGELTDLGSWYLGGQATGNLPSDASDVVMGRGRAVTWRSLGAVLAASIVVW